MSGKADPEVYIPIIIACFLLFLTWVTFGLDGLSNNLFMISLYTLFVPALFFTFGAFIEQQVVKKQIDRVVADVKNTAEDLDHPIPIVNIPPATKAEDDIVKRYNEQTVRQAFTVMGPMFAGGIILSYILWRVSKKRASYNFIVFSNLLLLMLIAMVEMLFFGLVTLNYRSLDTNMIARTALTKIGEKMGG